jgi:hypothetical protein
MPITVSGPCEIHCSQCQAPCRLDLVALDWKYHRSFEPSMLVLSSYRAQALLPCCGRSVVLELEFASEGGEFECPVLIAEGQRYQEAPASCDGHEYWAEVGHEMAGPALAYLRQGVWPDWRLEVRDSEVCFLEGAAVLWRWPQDWAELWLAGPERLYVRLGGQWWESRQGGREWRRLEDFLDGFLCSQLRFWKQLC